MFRQFTSRKKDDPLPEPGLVGEARRQLLLRTDEQLAHKLHDDEIVSHLCGNKCRNERIREDFPVAAAIQAEDKSILLEETERHKHIAERDAILAKELQRKLELKEASHLTDRYTDQGLGAVSKRVIGQTSNEKKSKTEDRERQIQKDKIYIEHKPKMYSDRTIENYNYEHYDNEYLQGLSTALGIPPKELHQDKKRGWNPNRISAVPNHNERNWTDAFLNSNPSTNPSGLDLPPETPPRPPRKDDLSASHIRHSGDLPYIYEEISEIGLALGISTQKLVEERKRLLQEEKDAKLAKDIHESENTETRDRTLAQTLQERELERYKKFKERQQRKSLENKMRSNITMTETYSEPFDRSPCPNDEDSQYMEVLPVDTSHSRNSEHVYKHDTAGPNTNTECSDDTSSRKEKKMNKKKKDKSQASGCTIH